DLLPLAACLPTSFAYSGSMSAAPPATPPVATCQTATKIAKNSSERTAARKPREASIGSGPLDREALEVVLWLRGVECLAHDLERLVGGGGRGEAHFLHELRGIGGEKHLLGDLLVVDVALDLSPALHLRENPDREALPREGIEIDPVRHFLHFAE